MPDPAAPAPPPAASVGAAEFDASLRLAARRVEDGERGAIDRLSRALDRFDRFDRCRNAGPAAPPFDEEDEGAAKFDARLDDLMRRVAEDKARAAAARGGRTAARRAGFNLPAIL